MNHAIYLLVLTTSNSFLGLTYWIFGYALSFGRSEYTNGFIALGDFCIDPTNDDPIKGEIFSAFLFQMSFATTATTIVSGAMAERSVLILINKIHIQFKIS